MQPVVVVLLTLLHLGAAQWLNNVNVPVCARSCASLLPTECAGNPRCVCTRQDWMIAAQCCVQANCADSDVAITEQFAAQLCNYVNAPINRPTNCPGVSRPQSTASTLASSVRTSSTSKPASSSTSKPATTSAVSSTKTSSAVTATTTGTQINGFTYQGCYTEATNGGRILDRTYYIDLVGLTVEKCTQFCKDRGNIYAGVEYTQECWCGNSIVNGGTKTDENRCNLPCKGNAQQKCGGNAVVGVYKSG